MSETILHPQRPEEKGSPVKAIAVGALVDIFGSIIVGVIIAVIYGVMLAGSGVSTEEIAKRFSNIDPYSAFSIIATIIGCFISLVSGYVCARIVNFSEYKFVAILGLISSTFGVILGGSTGTVIENVFIVLLTFISVMLGAWVHVNDKAKQNL